MTNTVFSGEGSDVLGEIDYNVNELDAFVKKAFAGIVFLLLIHSIMLAIIVSYVLFEGISK